MYTTDRNKISDMMKSRDGTSSRYLTSQKKKFYLASNDENFEQLKEKQLKDLNQVIINLKSEYDNIIKETNQVREESENLIKKTKMLEDKEKKIKTKINDIEENNTNLSSILEMKKIKKQEETYAKHTLLHILQNLREEVITTKKDVSVYTQANEKLHKELEKQKIQENNIKQRIDHICSNVNNQKSKNSLNKNEYDLQLNYYHNIISQRWNFIKSSDERKEQQKKIAEIAKNSTQDEQEVKCRKTLFFCYLYNKYLHKAMDKELMDNEKVEETFQLIRDISGGTNLKLIVDKILKHDKNYNQAVTKVSEKETTKEIIQGDINALTLKLQELINQTINVEVTNINITMEEDDKILVDEERDLTHSLKILQEKHNDVKLIYENIIDNIRNLTDKKEDNLSISASHVDLSNIIEDDIIRQYNEFLLTMKNKVETLFMTQTHEQFKDIMRTKGYESNTNRLKSKNRSSFIQERDERLYKDLKKEKSEYEKNDEFLKEEDANISKARASLIDEYKRKEEEKLKAVEKEKAAKK